MNTPAPFGIDEGTTFVVNIDNKDYDFDIADVRVYFETSINEKTTNKELIEISRKYVQEHHSIILSPARAMNFYRFADIAWNDFKKKFEPDSISSALTESIHEITQQLRSTSSTETLPEPKLSESTITA